MSAITEATVHAATAPRLLGLAGSLRRHSYSTSVLTTAAALIRAKAHVSVFPLGEIPLYNADLDGEPKPEPVRALKEAIQHSDGLLICSPEYGYGIPGVLKNALDWASRPAFKSPLKGKPALIMTTSPGYTGGARAHAQIRETLAGALARAVARPQVVIAGVDKKIVDGRLVDEPTINFVLEAIEDLLAEIRLIR